MRKSKARTVEFRRKRKKKTDYHLRIKLLSSKKPRLVVRKKLNNLTAQIIIYEPKGDKVLVSAHTGELKNLGWKYHKGNIPSAYLLGFLIGKKAAEKKIKEVILDIGQHTSIKEGAVYAVLKGAVDTGLNIPHNKKIFPSEEKAKGGAISRYAGELSKKDQEKYKKQFSSYIKQGINPQDITKNFEEVKKKIRC